MLRSLLGNKRLLFLLVFFLLSIFFLSMDLQKTPFSIIEKPITGTISLFTTMTSFVINHTQAFWINYVNLVGVQEENVLLRKEIERLTAEQIRLQGINISNVRMETLLGFIESSSLRMFAARVVGRNPDNWYQTLIINKGDDDGVQMDMGVVTLLGVVGRVVKVKPRLSQVLLMGDRNSAIASIVERTRDEGIVEGVDGNHLLMKYLPLTAEVAIGDRILTSGLAGFFPKGLWVGTVEEILREEADLFIKLQIRPSVNFSKLEEVLLIDSLPLHGPREFLKEDLH